MVTRGELVHLNDATRLSRKPHDYFRVIAQCIIIWGQPSDGYRSPASPCPTIRGKLNPSRGRRTSEKGLVGRARFTRGIARRVVEVAASGEREWARDERGDGYRQKDLHGGSTASQIT